MKTSNYYFAKAKNHAWKALVFHAAAVAILSLVIAGCYYHLVWAVCIGICLIGPAIHHGVMHVRDACRCYRRSRIC